MSDHLWFYVELNFPFHFDVALDIADVAFTLSSYFIDNLYVVLWGKALTNKA